MSDVATETVEQATETVEPKVQAPPKPAKPAKPSKPGEPVVKAATKTAEKPAKPAAKNQNQPRTEHKPNGTPKGVSHAVTKATAKLPSKENPTRLRKYAAISLLFKALGDRNRCAILDILKDRGGEVTVGQISVELGQSQPAVSHHIALMRHQGLVEPNRQGKNNFYELTDQGRELANLIKVVEG